MEKLFDANDENDVLRAGKVISPTVETITGGQEVYNKAFRKALDDGALLAVSLSKVLEEQGIWSESKDKRLTILYLLLKKNENKLKNKDQSEADAQKYAMEMRELRRELNDLSEIQTSFSGKTAEGQADEVRYNYYIVQCVIDKETNKPYYQNIQDFIQRSGSDFAQTGSRIFGCMLHDVDPDYEEKLPEEMFFKRFGEPKLDLTEEDAEIQALLEEVVESSSEDETDWETIEYGKPVKKPAKRGRPKKEKTESK